MNSTNNVISANTNINGDLLEKIIIQNDLSGLKPVEKIMYIKNVCVSLGLNYLTKPIQLLKFNGKEVMYFTKDATEQLRKINSISLTSIEGKVIGGDIYVTTANAKTSDGREDVSTSAVSIAGLKGEAMCNAIMKAETKAKRRVTLSICGLGCMDESETDSIKDAVRIDVYKEHPKLLAVDSPSGENIEESIIDEMLLSLQNSQTLEDLQVNYKDAYSVCGKARDKNALTKIINMKDKCKLELEKKFNQELDDIAKAEEDINLGDIRGND
jgi:hypothetical protein